MNANSRRILERRNKRNTEVGPRIVDGEVVHEQEASPDKRDIPGRRTEKAVPTNRITISSTKPVKRASEAEPASTFAPKINKRSIKLTAAKRDGGKIEDHLLKQAEERAQKKKQEIEAKKTTGLV